MSTPAQGFADRTRAESFGTAAARYDRARPSYPAKLIDELMLSRPRAALDVGAGTGIVTRLLRERGLDALGLEIDARMADVARAHGLDVEVASFEEWEPGGRSFDLITSGQAWHWVEPRVGASKAASLLRPGGTLALFWNYLELDAADREAIDAVYQQYAPEIADSGAIRGSGARTVEVHRTQLDDAECFGTVTVRDYHWDHRYTRDEWLEMIQTHSDHLTLPPQRRTALIHELGTAIDSLGATVTAHYGTYALLARVG